MLVLYCVFTTQKRQITMLHISPCNVAQNIVATNVSTSNLHCPVQFTNTVNNNVLLFTHGLQCSGKIFKNNVLYAYYELDVYNSIAEIVSTNYKTLQVLDSDSEEHIYAYIAAALA